MDLFFATSRPTGPRRREPITCGIPWPRGVLVDVADLRLRDGNGRMAALQARILNRWPDGSVRWLLLDWQATVLGYTRYNLSIGGPDIQSDDPRVSVEQLPNGIHIDTGAAQFHVGGVRFPFDGVRIAGAEVVDAARTVFRAEDEKGQRYQPRIDSVTMEEPGPVRVVVCLRGVLAAQGKEPLTDFVARLHFFAGAATVRFVVALTNPRKADHPNGLWDLGNGGSIYLRDAALTVALATSFDEAVASASTEIGRPLERLALPVEIYQDSSGGENWQSTNHFNRQHKVPNTFRGYRLRAGKTERSGLRACPVLQLRRGSNTIGAAMTNFWQNFPKALEATEDTLTLRPFPRQYADLHELQGGEQKTHCFCVAFAPDAVSDVPLDWCRVPMLAHAAPDWYCASGALPYLTPRAEDPHPDYLRLVDAAIEGTDTFERKREVIDEYGWRHFGDVYGDHEAVFHKGPAPLVSHYNNQYDAVAGFVHQFLRSGDERWWRAMDELASHIIDVDTYHTDRDKAAYNRGLFWHTYHYVDADTAGHRTYPKAYASQVGGGGPANEQNYAQGLTLHHFLTGDPASRETALGFGEWVLAMDDGRLSPFRWLAGGPTGLASKSRTESYHGPGRGSANSLGVLLDCFQLSGERRFLDKAEELIRRVIHPADDVPARQLLDAENRWFYLMFLQSLGRYLDCKIERGELDAPYAYGRASLLHYARWMSAHEYPYLEKPEILEYPTETWAAQDMRKCDVFQFAAKHSTETERAGFLERAEFFFRYSATKLSEMPTRTLARPVILLLSFGWMRAWFKKHPDASAPAPSVAVVDFGQPTAFVPQKVRAKKRFLVLAAAAGLACALAGGALAWKLLS